MINHERYNFLTKNHVPFENMLPINELKKNLTQVKNYDGIIESFYESIERESLDIDSLDKYINNIIENLNDYS